MVREDGAEMLVYTNGKRLANGEWLEAKGERKKAIETAQLLQVTILDVHELEKRIRKTSLEVQKYQKRLNE